MSHSNTDERFFDLFRKMDCYITDDSGTRTQSGNDRSLLNIDKMILHVMNCLSVLHWATDISGTKYEQRKSLEIFWENCKLISLHGLRSSSAAMNENLYSAQACVLRNNFPRAASEGEESNWLKLQFAISLLLPPNDSSFVALADIVSIAAENPSCLESHSLNAVMSPGHVVCACKEPKLEHVRAIFDMKPRMAHYKDGDGRLPLHVATRYSHSKELIEHLLQLNPSATTVVDAFGDTPLLRAVKHNESPFCAVVTLVQANKAVLDAVDHEGNTALHHLANRSIHRDSSEVVELCQYIHSINPELVKFVNSNGETALHSCANDPAVASYLLEIHPEAAEVIDVEMFYAAHSAAYFSSLDVFKIVAAANPSAMVQSAGEHGTPLHQALLRSDGTEVALFICNNYPDALRVPNSRDALPLHYAVINSRYKVNSLPGDYSLSSSGSVFALIKKIAAAYPAALKTPISSDGSLPLHSFVRAMMDTVPHDVDHLGDIDDSTRKKTVTESLNILHFLIRQYPDSVAVADAQGHTPYSLVCATQPEFIRRILLRAKPHIDIEAYRALNYKHRRMAIFVGFSATVIKSKRPLLSVLAFKYRDVFKLIVSFL